MIFRKLKGNLLLLYTVLGVCLFIIFMLGFTGIFKSDIDFKRIHLIAGENNNQKELQKHKINAFKSNHQSYIDLGTEGATFKGGISILNSNQRSIEIFPKLSGKYSFYIDFFLFLKKREKVKFTLLHNEKKLDEVEFSRRDLFCFAPSNELDLNKEDKVIFEIKGMGNIVLSNPIFYKKKPKEKRNQVFLICADTLRADHLPIYGYKRNTAPNIQAFAKDSVIFQNAYSQAPWTLPSHMSLFTSLYEYNHGVKKQGQLSSKINFLIEELSKSFITRSINGGGWLKVLFGFYRGFDYYKSYGRCGAKPDSAKTLFNKVIEDLKSIHFPQTFYFLHCYQIHSPYQPRQKFLTYINPNPKYRKLITSIGWSIRRTDSQKVNEIRKAMIDLYDGEIRAFDYWFGEFLKYLKKSNIYDTSMIVFISDHGEEFHDHGKWGHNHSLYNEVSRVPLIIKFPKNKFKRTVVKNEVGLIDVMPTILRYYNTDFNQEAINGQDLLSVIKGKSINRSLFSSISNGMYSPKDAFKVAVFRGFTKIICNLPYKKAMSSDFSLSSKKIEVYDLIEDPNEMRNLNLKEINKIKYHQNIFDDIIKKGINSLKRRGKSPKIDKKTKESLKALGYL